MKNIFSSWLRNTMLVAVLFFAAAPLSHAQEVYVNDLDSLILRTAGYAQLTPAERIALLLDDDSRDLLVPDNVIFLKDLKALFGVGMDSSRYKIDTPNPFSSVEDAQSYYNTLMAIVQSGTNYSVVYDTVSLPEDVVADVLFNIHDSSSCGYNQWGEYTCPLTLPILLNVLNAYYSCTPAERAIFYDTFCNPNSTSAVAQLFNNRMQLSIEGIPMPFYELIATTDMASIDDTSGNLDAFRYNALPGVFTIDAYGGKVHFSKGNLQYRPSSNEWRFAENQYDIIGADNSHIAEAAQCTYWIDLFGWGTGSLYDYPPFTYDSVMSSQYPQYGPVDERSITGTVSDWGYNAITNGGNEEHAWRTMTNSEWNYLLRGRGTSCSYSKATVVGTRGLILFPDGYNSASSGVTINNMNVGTGNYSSNELSLATWNILDSLGCVFLPAAGYREGTRVMAYNSTNIEYNSGFYWSSSAPSADSAYNIHFRGIDMYFDDKHERYYGFSVRPVRDVSVIQSEVGQFQSIDGTGTNNNSQNPNTNGIEGDGTVTDPVTDDDNPPANTGVVTGGPQ